LSVRKGLPCYAGRIAMNRDFLFGELRSVMIPLGDIPVRKRVGAKSETLGVTISAFPFHEE
jgi:hypothetical protein